MKRWIRRVLAFLLIGAVACIGLAATLECSRPTVRGNTRIVHGHDPLWDRFQPPGFPRPTLLKRGEDLGRLYFVAFGITPDGVGMSASVRLAGWPLPCLRSWDQTTMPRDRSVGTNTSFGLLDLGEARGEWVARRLGMYATDLPIAPVWWGLVGDSVLYAGVLWVLVFVPLSVRSAIRRYRALCPACAYPTTGTSHVCTECGKPMKPRSAVAA